MPLTPAECRANLNARFAETFEADQRAAAEMRGHRDAAVALIASHLGPRRIVLFGSLATGLFSAEDSDIDLAVDGLGFAPSYELQQAADALFGRRVDLIDPALTSEYVRARIARDGIVLCDPDGSAAP